MGSGSTRVRRRHFWSALRARAWPQSSLTRGGTMLTKAQIDDAAARLDEAERTRRQIGQLSLQYPSITIEDAYAIQKSWVAGKIAAGRRMIGHKIGLTSKALQSASQISEPAF